MLKSNDYFVTTNLSRLGRNWDEIKKEWFLFDYHKINKIIIDNVNLCVELPNEQKGVLDLSKKMVQDITFSACLYASCQKIEEVRQSTKDGLEKARLSGKILGAPKGKYTTKENFIKTIKLANEICSIRKACDVTSFPQGTFTLWLKKYKKQFNVEKNIDLLPYLEKLDF